jgi:UDP-N-acetyl-D-glucosamine/UDP-N-acetyl-D-galactosamine dehydrogenase
MFAYMSVVHPSRNPIKIGVLGLGYVGLPLAVALSAAYETLGFDINEGRIAELREGKDRTREVDPSALTGETRLAFSCEAADLKACNVFIITVPTPIDAYKRPDLGALLSASRTVASALKPGDVVIYESTVYPGATEEDCVPVLEQVSGLTFNQDFFAGYSPERANPGDREHGLSNIIKVTAGSTPQAAEFVDGLYAAIIPAGTHRASSIRVAEAAKVIENTQRDLNIALVNELSLIFHRMGLDTLEILEAAGTKWNFLKFRPGLVGGHCIGVDPYYLTHKAESVGYLPQVILAGRRINDGMGAHVASQLVKAMIKRRIHVAGSRILIMGLAFKENCPDIRNSRVIDVVNELRGFEAEVDVHDPWVNTDEAEHEYGLRPLDEPVGGSYDAVVVAVAHDTFRDMGVDAIRALCKPDHVIHDIKGILAKESADLRL